MTELNAAVKGRIDDLARQLYGVRGPEIDLLERAWARVNGKCGPLRQPVNSDTEIFLEIHRQLTAHPMAGSVYTSTMRVGREILLTPAPKASTSKLRNFMFVKHQGIALWMLRLCCEAESHVEGVVRLTAIQKQWKKSVSSVQETLRSSLALSEELLLLWNRIASTIIPPALTVPTAQQHHRAPAPACSSETPIDRASANVPVASQFLLRSLGPRNVVVPKGSTNKRDPKLKSTTLRLVTIEQTESLGGLALLFGPEGEIGERIGSEESLDGSWMVGAVTRGKTDEEDLKAGTSTVFKNRFVDIEIMQRAGERSEPPPADALAINSPPKRERTTTETTRVGVKKLRADTDAVEDIGTREQDHPIRTDQDGDQDPGAVANGRMRAGKKATVPKGGKDEVTLRGTEMMSERSMSAACKNLPTWRWGSSQIVRWAESVSTNGTKPEEEMSSLELWGEV